MVQRIALVLAVILATTAGIAFVLDSAVPEPSFAQARFDGASRSR